MECLTVKNFSVAVLSLQLVATVERVIFDFLGYMWTSILFNIINIVFIVVALFGVTQDRRRLLVAHMVWSVVWIGCNIFVICFYLEAGTLNNHGTALNMGLSGFSWWASNGAGCEVNRTATNIVKYPITTGCVLDYIYVETIHAAIQLLLTMLSLCLMSVIMSSKKKERTDSSQAVVDALEFIRVRQASSDTLNSQSHRLPNGTSVLAVQRSSASLPNRNKSGKDHRQRRYSVGGNGSVPESQEQVYNNLGLFRAELPPGEDELDIGVTPGGLNNGGLNRDSAKGQFYMGRSNGVPQPVGGNRSSGRSKRSNRSRAPSQRSSRSRPSSQRSNMSRTTSQSSSDIDSPHHLPRATNDLSQALRENIERYKLAQTQPLDSLSPSSSNLTDTSHQPISGVRVVQKPLNIPVNKPASIPVREESAAPGMIRVSESPIMNQDDSSRRRFSAHDITLPTYSDKMLKDFREITPKRLSPLPLYSSADNSHLSQRPPPGRMTNNNQNASVHQQPVVSGPVLPKDEFSGRNIQQGVRQQSPTKLDKQQSPTKLDNNNYNRQPYYTQEVNSNISNNNRPLPPYTRGINANISNNQDSADSWSSPVSEKSPPLLSDRSSSSGLNSSFKFGPQSQSQQLQKHQLPVNQQQILKTQQQALQQLREQAQQMYPAQQQATYLGQYGQQNLKPSNTSQQGVTQSQPLSEYRLQDRQYEPRQQLTNQRLPNGQQVTNQRLINEQLANERLTNEQVANQRLNEQFVNQRLPYEQKSISQPLSMQPITQLLSLNQQPLSQQRLPNDPQANQPRFQNEPDLTDPWLPNQQHLVGQQKLLDNPYSQQLPNEQSKSSSVSPVQRPQNRPLNVLDLVRHSTMRASQTSLSSRHRISGSNQDVAAKRNSNYSTDKQSSHVNIVSSNRRYDEIPRLLSSGEAPPAYNKYDISIDHDNNATFI